MTVGFLCSVATVAWGTLMTLRQGGNGMTDRKLYRVTFFHRDSRTYPRIIVSATSEDDAPVLRRGICVGPYGG